MPKINLRNKYKIQIYLRENNPLLTDAEIVEKYQNTSQKGLYKILQLIGKAKFGEIKHTFNI